MSVWARGRRSAAARLRWILLAWVLDFGLVPTVLTARAAEPGPRAEPRRQHATARYVPTRDDLTAAYQRAQPSRRLRAPVYKLRITPHWFAHNTRFWYRNDLRGGAKEFILVDAARGQRGFAFDHEKLAAALSKATGKHYRGDHLPFDSIEISSDTHRVRFTVDEAMWEVVVPSYRCTKTAADVAGPLSRAPPASTEAQPQEESPFFPNGSEETTAPESRPATRRRGGSAVSPDHQWTAFVRDHNLWLRSEKGQETQLSRDGKPGLAYGLPNWAPDSQKLAAFRIEPGDHKEVYLIESSPPGGGRARLHKRPYDLPGDKLTSYELNLFQIRGFKHLKPKVERIDLGFPRLRWSADGSRVTVEKTDRGHQRFRLIEVDARSGAVRNLIDEKSRTFI
ncbi:MAG TPA: DPP IV N-terminal domain-containing protein, partial [Gemmataceae bacterium]|nr:DPP IV N-terminal domain-containing protein [Gemmataceae bacterium]